MAKKILVRFFRAVFLMVVVSIVTFGLVELSPIDTVDAYVGENGISEEKRQQIEEYWGLNEPPVVR